jgi:hypothetical protein
MAAPQYIKQLPEENASITSFFFVNYNLIAPKVEAMAQGLTLPQLRQLQALQMATIQRRKLYIGSCQWLKITPSNGAPYPKRRANFEANREALQALNYIQVIDIYNGQQNRLTLKGEYLCTQINTFLTDYYQKIFAQFNLKAVI